MKYFIIAGEASGDLHGSNLMKQLKLRDSQAQFVFLGGDLMAEQGGVMVKHYRDMAFMGFINVVLNAGKVLDNFKHCKRAIAEFSPDAVIFIDYPGFNLKMAKWVKTEYPSMRTIYYISPKLWSWKGYRIKTIKRYVDKMYTIFPFETEYFGSKGYSVTYVGNPSVDSVSAFLEADALTDPDSEKFRKKHRLGDKPIIAVLPGSRRQEIAGCLKKMMAVASDFPQYRFVIAGAPGMDSEIYSYYAGSVVTGETYNLLKCAEAAIVNSGTATLEAALLGTRQVVVYDVFGGRLANLAHPILLRMGYASLVNIILGREAVKELLAGDFTAKNIKKELHRILEDDICINKMRDDYDRLRKTLGGPGAAERCAAYMVEYLREKMVEPATN